MQKNKYKMKLICLNIWGGALGVELLEFLEYHKNVDIFCFQEVYNMSLNIITKDNDIFDLRIFKKIEKIISNHKGYFTSPSLNSPGMAVFIKKDIRVLDKGKINIYFDPYYNKNKSNHPRDLQWVKCQIYDKVFTIMNVHGLWNGMGKTDSDSRIIQSQKIKSFMDSIDTPKILCGDFNLSPDTNSIALIQSGMNNLIQHYDIISTRTKLYEKREKHSDYIFTCKDIKIICFKILDDIISDHAPLFLFFSI